MIEKQLSYKFKVYQKIKEDIITGVYSQGEILNERKLSEELGISRTPIREALQLLNRDGWIINETYKGAVVRTFDENYINNVLKVREPLEIVAVEGAINNITKEDINYLEKLLDKQEKSLINYKPKDFMNLDRELHLKICNLSKNEILIGVLRNINDIIRILGIQALSVPERNKSTLKEHRDIVEAIKIGNVEQARICMQRHMEETAKNILNFMTK